MEYLPSIFDIHYSIFAFKEFSLSIKLAALAVSGTPETWYGTLHSDRGCRCYAGRASAWRGEDGCPPIRVGTESDPTFAKVIFFDQTGSCTASGRAET
jgi:hypothetical protein